MPPRFRPLIRTDVTRAVSSEQKTKDFRHLLTFPKRWAARYSYKDPAINSVHHEQRIKWWNVVPGDKVRVMGDPSRNLQEVIAVNKLSNRVYLRNPDKPSQAKNVPYSACQLFVGHHNFAGSGHPDGVAQPVFATRVGKTKPVFRDGFWQWTRYAVNTNPRVPKDGIDGIVEMNDGRLGRVIQWPKEREKGKTTPGVHDTSEQVVHEVTYSPPQLGSAAQEDLYIRSLGTFGGPLEGQTLPESVNDMKMEVRVYRELANPHSRAKKQARWQEKQEADKALLQKMITAEEAKDRFGRSKKEARALAVYKWRMHMNEERKKEMNRRWVKRGGLEKEAKREARKEKKAARTSRALAQLVLEEAPNQVIPRAH